ncbi:hypothetical protein DPX16_22196 [Anabarilius grahami]|uniref:Uncharacterized protein n=1 Tax=Anabarilius grahami TaxID=495550 RepID=A0A3N0XQA8_ANAGA|nr:hypothetical protein DPX16_22196 [Anabarilius grahami]
MWSGCGHCSVVRKNQPPTDDNVFEENVSEKTQEEEEEEEETLYHSNRECQRLKRMRELLYGTLSLMPTRSRRSGGNPPYAFILVTGTALDIRTDSASPLHLLCCEQAARRDATEELSWL